jgi:hypothetical protein
VSHRTNAALLVQEIDDLGDGLLREGLESRDEILGFFVVAGHEVHEKNAVSFGEVLVFIGVLFEVAAES